jgi:hypothetical protein
MKNFISVSPLKVLEMSSRKALEVGNLGVVMARAGVGKTACLIHIGLHKIFQGGRIVHISLEEGPDKVAADYNVRVNDIITGIGDDREYRTLIDENRMILVYLNRIFGAGRLRANLSNLAENLGFRPNALVVDGIDFENAGRTLFEDLKDIAMEFELEVWLSALSHRHILKVNERGIPYPCHELDDIFSIIIQLEPATSGIVLRLLKDHDNPVITNAEVMLDPNTFLVLEKEGAGG